ncbi:uncharacterized protein F4822DRAFT_442178 [Hypoxylon trugodes]|uniref:uncharacterized protein n=1 Tax=Hypoxylon trugodes TaxID=326681 RepID=UPI00218E7FAD|nr:uncharacterized protein F4822DRAFT_442178 [Hypoxylon trugodes]KAI1390976.1 hypothetical protein F4822DRAFT_442178 [Hypoxylon trugodes]
MPFPYRYVCDLLQQLNDESHKRENKQRPARVLIETWFREHRAHLNADGNDASAILSTLLPERRTDRVYYIQVSRLESIFGKALLLGASRVQELRRYTTPGLGVDLADCIEGILTRTPNPSQSNNELTVEEIDETLSSIAATCRFSSPSVRALRKSQDTSRNQPLIDIYRRLSPRDAKWFTRLVLKNYQPVAINEHSVFRFYHPLLSQMIKVRDDLTIATPFLRQINRSPHDQSAIAKILKPSIGTKIGRQVWLKGRSIKHCLDMGRGREISCEQKIDGEYCQIHIDLSKRHSPIQIFSKSGKDSTEDRVNLHQPIKDSLRLDTPDCPFNVGCILEGELVVYSAKDNKILPFHKIRKHVSRSGSYIGTYYDSQPHAYEHLMIIYYDVLMIDDESLLGTRQSERFRRLSELITPRKGYAELVQRETISFTGPSAALKLREAFAKCIVSRGEGLVLKPDEPYIDFSSTYKPYSCCNIKLKKEYVQGWGDVGDFAVVGASYDATKAKEYKRPHVKWTHFFIGCLDNREKARAGVEKLRFIITNVVELSETLLLTVMTQCFPSPEKFDANQSMVLDFSRGHLEKRPTDVFLDPLVFDMRCFSFSKDYNTNFWAMRFPMVSKIHHDRSYWDTITFSELQEVAATAVEAPEAEDSQEMRQWIAALEKADPRGIAVDVMTQESVPTEKRPSIMASCDGCQEKADRPGLRTDPHSEGCSANESFPPCRGADESAWKPYIGSRSPAIKSLQHKAPSNFSSASQKTSMCQKRPAPDTVVTTKKRRKSSDTPSSQSRSMVRSAGLPSSPQWSRKPLSQIDANSQPRSSEILVIDLTTPVATQSQTRNDVVPPLDESNMLVDAAPNSARTQDMSKQHNSSKCSLVEKKCLLRNCSILLSPCISKYAWVTDLLQKHGIDNFVVDPESWVQGDAPAGSTTKEDAPSQKTQKQKARKICLVESRRREATLSFYGKIEAAGLKKKNGEREWVGVYDWRILEDISDMESGKRLPEGMDPWRKHHIGIA